MRRWNASSPCGSSATVRSAPTGRPACASHSSSTECVPGSSTPSASPTPYAKKRSGRLAVIDGSSCRRLPAAALRGLTNSLVAGVHAGAAFSSVEIAPVHQHLAAHLEHTRCDADQPQRNRAHRAEVRRDVLAAGTVAAGRTLHQQAVLVAQADRDAVVLQLGAVAQLRARQAFLGEPFAHATIECQHLVVVESVVQRQHRQRMAHRGEGPRDRAADALGRGIGNLQPGLGALERLQFAKQPVVLGVGHARRVEHVVLVVVAGELRAQLRGARFRVVHRGRPGIRRLRHHRRRQLNTLSASAEPAGRPIASSDS